MQRKNRVVSSVGLEHYLDRVGVTGSNPVQPTKGRLSVTTGSLFFKIIQSTAINISSITLDPKNINPNIIGNMRVVTIAILALIYFSFPISAQKNYDNNTSIEQQFEFVEEEGSKWQNYVMIIDRSFNQLKGNVLKTINNKDATISRLETTIVSKDSLITALEVSLAETDKELQKTLSEKNSFSLLGISMSKNLFLSIVIFVLIVLLAIMGFTTLLIRKNYSAMTKVKKELETTRTEFDEHRQRSRQKYESLVIQHHKEIQRLKGL